MLFYGAATTKEGKNIIITNLPNTRVNAQNEAERICKLRGLKFQYILPAKKY